MHLVGLYTYFRLMNGAYNVKYWIIFMFEIYVFSSEHFDCWILMMKALWSFEATSTTYRSTRCQIPEASNLHQHSCENLALICVNRQLFLWVWSTVDCVVKFPHHNRSGMFFSRKRVALHNQTHFNLHIYTSVFDSNFVSFLCGCVLQHSLDAKWALRFCTGGKDTVAWILPLTSI